MTISDVSSRFFARIVEFTILFNNLYLIFFRTSSVKIVLSFSKMASL